MNLDNEHWRQVFCAALTGVLAGWKEDPEPGDGDDPYRDDAFDACMFAATVADEAFRSTKPEVSE
jgi:hypothetical protein